MMNDQADLSSMKRTPDEGNIIRPFDEWKQVSDTVVAGEREESKSQHWLSPWHTWKQSVHALSMSIEADVDIFANKTIEVVVDGSGMPYTDKSGIPHDWYGRCMIAILDENRWLMAFRSGLNHIAWGKRDAIHLITSSNEGRTWGDLNCWFDGSDISGMPFEDGHTHSEAGIYPMPNGDLILQFWRTGYSSGTKQLRSTDDGKTWILDIDRISIQEVVGADGDRVLGTEDYFIDPECPSHVYMAFQYFHYDGQSGTLLACSDDSCRSYRFVGWISPLGDEKGLNAAATFEPAIEYVGDRTIVSILRDMTGQNRTLQTSSSDMGRSFGPVVNIANQIDGGVNNGQWQRVRLYKESNPNFQHSNRMDYKKGEGRLWGFGLHSNGGGYTRKPVVYWSDNNGQSWSGPELLHGPIYPGTDTGYGDLKRRIDGTFVGATYYANDDSTMADVEQYTFGGNYDQVKVEVDDNGNGRPDMDSGWHRLSDGVNLINMRSLSGGKWRLRLQSSSNTRPKIKQVQTKAWH